ncbi:hypothetical protein [Streptomyces sp. NRRL B-3229]|uniref:hypothetical protein n=1 Tax=Streptomyces sp. NRRL B-3229 TaxID=1463836 RepID=UPI0004BF0BAE|nr:hypothetical protein [Streptomyces sp. NRRL B-3229]
MTYRDVASPQVLVWACTSVGARMPVAMAPLALVFLVRERPGGYALGAVLAAVYVIGEIVGAPVLGMRLRPERPRPHLAAGLAAGAAGFAGLGLLPDVGSLILGGCAVLAGSAPAAVTGGLRALLTELVPERAVPQALSTESMLNSVIWAVSPAAVTGLALGVAPRVPLLLAAVLMGASLAGLWLLPSGWKTGSEGGTRTGQPSTSRLLLGAWPVYVTGAASLSLLGLAELALPALLEQRGIRVGWSGPMLAGLAVGGGLGAFLYGLRTWPGLLRTRSVVLMCGTSVCVTLLALTPDAAGIAAALAVGGLLQSGALVTRNLALREVLPPTVLAAGYSVMYAAAGAGYAATGSLAGALLTVTVPSRAVLAGVVLTLVLTGVGWWGEARRTRGSGGCAGGVVAADPPAPAAGSSPAGHPVFGREPGPGPEGAAVRGRGDAEGRL